MDEVDELDPGREPDEAPDHDARARTLPKWLVPGLIGLVTITAGLVTWRAGQLGSSAAYQDRQSVGQTISEQTQATEAGLATLGQASGYVAFAADLAEADALEDLATEADGEGRPEIAGELRARADEVRRSASTLAGASGVLSQQELLDLQLSGGEGLAPFDAIDSFESNEATIASRVTAPGNLEPQKWADLADDTRARVWRLRFAATLMLVAVAAYTVAELASRRRTRTIGFLLGGVVYLATFVAIVPGAW